MVVGEGGALPFSLKVGTEIALYLYRLSPRKAASFAEGTGLGGILQHSWSNIIFNAYMPSSRHPGCIWRWDSFGSNTWPRNQEKWTLNLAMSFLRPQLPHLYNGNTCWFCSLSKFGSLVSPSSQGSTLAQSILYPRGYLSGHLRTKSYRITTLLCCFKQPTCFRGF